MNNRIGKFKVIKEQIEAFWDRINGFIPTDIDTTQECGAVIYTGTHKEFDELEMGDIIPYYDMTFTSENKEYKISRINLPASS
jgi:hypothetical protein